MSLVLAQIVFGLVMFVMVPSCAWFGSQKYPRSETGFAISTIPSLVVAIVLLAVSHYLLPPAWTGRLVLAEIIGLALGLALLAVLMRMVGDEDG